MAIVTDSFAALAQTYATSRGMPALPLAIVKHPVGGLSSAQARELMVPAVPSAIEGLTLSPEVLAVRAGQHTSDFRPPRPQLKR